MQGLDALIPKVNDAAVDLDKQRKEFEAFISIISNPKLLAYVDHMQFGFNVWMAAKQSAQKEIEVLKSAFSHGVEIAFKNGYEKAKQSEMTEERARKIFLNFNNCRNIVEIKNEEVYVSDDTFSLEELKAIVYLMESHK